MAAPFEEVFGAPTFRVGNGSRFGSMCMFVSTVRGLPQELVEVILQRKGKVEKIEFKVYWLNSRGEASTNSGSGLRNPACISDS